MSHNMQTLLTTAAELRSGGYSWDSVASQVHRSVKTVRQWPLRYPNDWKLFYRQAQKKRHEEAASEALCCLRHLLQGEDERVRVKAADCLLKFEQMEEVEEELSEEEYEMQKMVSDYRIRHQAACKAVNSKREQQGLAPLAGKALRDAGHHFLVELFCGGKVARGEEEKEKQVQSADISTASNSTFDATKTLVVLWFLISLSLLGFLGYRDYQRKEIDRTNLFFASAYLDTIEYMTKRSREKPSYDHPISQREEFSSQASTNPNDSLFALPRFGEMVVEVDVLNVVDPDDSVEDSHFPRNLEVASKVRRQNAECRIEKPKPFVFHSTFCILPSDFRSLSDKFLSHLETGNYSYSVCFLPIAMT
jgi:hypothetical protein